MENRKGSNDPKVRCLYPLLYNQRRDPGVRRLKGECIQYPPVGIGGDDVQPIEQSYDTSWERKQMKRKTRG